MPISFPANPTANQTYTYNNSVWRYDGNSWVRSGTSITGPADVSDRANTSTGFFSLPRGTTAQRPTSVNDGYMRFNTDLDRVEYYDVTLASWITVSGVTSTASSMSVEYLIVAGGGGGGAAEAGNTDGKSEGGDGTASSITGSSVTYAGGGGGGMENGVGGPGGAGGGGNGSYNNAGAGGSPGTANTGGGGGGGGYSSGAGGSGFAGGSGIVIIKINQ